MTKTALPGAEIRGRANAIATQLQTALAAVDEAHKLATNLYLDFEHGRTGLPRFDYEVMAFVKTMAANLGAEIGDARGDFDLDHLTADAQDLIDLVDLAMVARVTPVSQAA